MFERPDLEAEEEPHGRELKETLERPSPADPSAYEDLHLPRHERCAAHTMNLLATTDAEVAFQDPGYRDTWKRVLSKCKALWTKQQHSTIASEVIRKHLGRSLAIPCTTRWNSLFNALDQVRQVGSALSTICDALNVPRLSADEMAFIQEYTTVSNASISPSYFLHFLVWRSKYVISVVGTL